MTDADLLSQAVAELYAADFDAFTQRRGELAAAARAAGDRAAAKQISGLRRPTRSAWVVNRLVRGDPTVAPRLAELGDELRSSEATRDGTRIRELSQARRRLIDALVNDAMAAAGLDSLALREEVSATLAAALADPEFAATMAEGTLLRAEAAPGFGSADMMALVPPVSPGSAATAPSAAAAAVPASAASSAQSAAAAAALAAEAERERKRRDEIARAEQALAEASQALEAAAEREQADQAAVRLIEQQLSEARRRLDESRREARRADSAVRQARQAHSRLQR